MRILQAAWMDANWACAMLVAGILLVYLECARPGWVVPGAAGAALVLVAVARWSTLPMRATGMSLLVCGVLLAAAEIKWRWGGPPGLASGVVLMLGFLRTVDDSQSVPVRWYVAAPAALAWSAATVVLGSAALRGWMAKRGV